MADLRMLRRIPHFNPLRDVALTGHSAHFGRFYRLSPAEQRLVFPQARYFSVAPTRSSLYRFRAKSSNNPEEHPKPVNSFMLDVLALLLKVPGLLLGIFGKGGIVQKVEDQLEDAADTVEKIAEVVEDVAESVGKVAGTIAEDAREARELIEKVEESSQSMRSEIGAAIDGLEEAANSEKETQSLKLPEDIRKASQAASRAAGRAEDVKQAAIQAAAKAEQVKAAAKELEREGSGGVVEPSAAPPDEDTPKMTAAAQYRRVVSGSFSSSERSKARLLLLTLAAVLLLTLGQAQVMYKLTGFVERMLLGTWASRA